MEETDKRHAHGVQPDPDISVRFIQYDRHSNHGFGVVVAGIIPRFRTEQWSKSVTTLILRWVIIACHNKPTINMISLQCE